MLSAVQTANFAFNLLKDGNLSGAAFCQRFQVPNHNVRMNLRSEEYFQQQFTSRPVWLCFFRNPLADFLSPSLSDRIELPISRRAFVFNHGDQVLPLQLGQDWINLPETLIPKMRNGSANELTDVITREAFVKRKDPQNRNFARQLRSFAESGSRKSQVAGRLAIERKSITRKPNDRNCFNFLQPPICASWTNTGPTSKNTWSPWRQRG